MLGSVEETLRQNYHHSPHDREHDKNPRLRKCVIITVYHSTIEAMVKINLSLCLTN
jgi:hypothetical protein